MKTIFTILFISLVPLLSWAENHIEQSLAPYKEFLEQGTYAGQDWSSFDPLPKSRYETFKVAFEHFEQNQGKVILELGTSRSFTHGGHPGCNSDNPSFWTPNNPENWDWGAGFFTRMAALSLHHLSPEFHTLDLMASHIARCKIMTSDFKDILHYHVSSSETFLQTCSFPNGIDLLYLDTGDMTPIEPTALLQLREAVIIVERNLIKPGGIILIDDVKNQTPKQYGDLSGLGKSKYALPYFLDHGFEMLMDEYQVLLRKKL